MEVCSIQKVGPTQTRKFNNPNTSYHLPMKMEQIKYSETSACIIQTPGNYQIENIINPNNMYDAVKIAISYVKTLAWQCLNV